MTKHPHASSPSGLPAGVVAGLVVSLATALGVAAWSTTTSDAPAPDNPLAFAPIRVDHERLDRQRRDKYGDAESSFDKAPTDKLLKQVRRLNELQFDEESRDEQKKVGDDVSYIANEVIPATGYEAFIAAGRPLFEKCRSGLDTLLSDLRAGEVSLDEARSDPDPDTYLDYRRNCGKLLPTLLERGLVDDRGHWTKPTDLKRTMFGILQRYRWANIIRTRRPPIDQLTDYERRLLMRWRIEDPHAYSLRERRNYLDRLEESPGLVPNYDVALARAKLAYAERDLHRTVRILKRQIREQSGDTARYKRALEWLERQHKAGDPGGSGAGESAG